MQAPKPTEGFLADFHDRAPGGSPRAFADWPVWSEDPRQSWPSSYHAVWDALPTPGLNTVLDLGCGDGHLLRLGATLPQAPSCRVGVDLSRGELRHGACAHTSDGQIRIQARAQALPLPPACVDAVISHMALMLMEDLDQVLTECARVLRPGGWWVAMLGGPPPPTPAWQVLRSALADPSSPQAPRQRLGDRRWQDGPALNQALVRAGLVPGPALALQMPRPMDGEAAWADVLAMYDIHQLPVAQHPRVQAALRGAWAQLPLQAQNLPLTLRRFVARRHHQIS